MTDGEAIGFKSILEKYLPKNSQFYNQACRVYDVLSLVRANSDGHGITFVLKRDEEKSGLDKYLVNAKPYNEKIHNIADQDIIDVVSNKREKDLATIINSYGEITGASVSLPLDIAKYQEKYCIDGPISRFLGYDEHEDGPGSRTQSAIYATDKFGDSILIFTLGVTEPDGKKGSINAFYCGDRIYSSSGRKMRWELSSKQQSNKSNVVYLAGVRNRLGCMSNPARRRKLCVIS
jgi:hypothetical protein